MTVPIVGTAPTRTVTTFDAAPFELTSERKHNSTLDLAEHRLVDGHLRQLTDSLRSRPPHRPAHSPLNMPVFARSSITRGVAAPIPDYCGLLTLSVLTRHYRQDYQQVQVSWDGTRLAVVATYAEGVLTQHWRPLNDRQYQRWSVWGERGGRYFQRMASAILDEPQFDLAMSLAWHVASTRRHGEFDFAVFAPALASVKATWPAGTPSPDPAGFAQLAESWAGTPEQLLYAARALL